MSDEILRIKELMTRYNRAQQAGCEATVLRRQLVPLLKNNGLTKTKFDFGDRTISYHTYNDYESITQRLIKAVIREKYPHINADQFVADVYGARKCKHIETVRAQNKAKNLGAA
jgi:hypothetical protein